MKRKKSEREFEGRLKTGVKTGRKGETRQEISFVTSC